MRNSKLDKLLSVKPKESYPDYIQKEVDLLTFDEKNPAETFGSYLFRFQKYSGDVDLNEIVLYDDEITTLNSFIKKLKSIIHNLDHNHVFSEFKAGFDNNFNFSIGTLSNGIFVPNPDLIIILQDRYENKLLTKEEFGTILKALLQCLDSSDTTINEMAYDYIFNLIRNKKILRWTKDELLKGSKILSDGTSYPLQVALTDDTIVKLDIISLLNNKFVEVTNIVSLQYHNPDNPNDIIPINIDSRVTLGNPEGLRDDIEKLYYSNKFFSPFKACKRIYSLIRKTEEYSYIENKLYPIISGDISLLYQIKSEIEAINIVLDKSPIKYHLRRVHTQLQDIKGRLNYVLALSEDDILDFSDIIDSFKDEPDNESRIELLEYLNKYIKEIINRLTIESMDDYDFNPFPSTFLPSIRQYDRSKVRRENEEPLVEYSDFVESL
jgi:hypothetical protein